jgi:hypothetical protein
MGDERRVRHGVGAPERRERLVEERGERCGGVVVPGCHAPLDVAAVPQHRERGGRRLALRLRQDGLDPAPDLAVGRRLLLHLVGDVTGEAERAVLDQRGNERVLGREVPVERVVREPRGRDDVGDTGPGGRAVLRDDGERGVEETPDLALVVDAAARERLRGDSSGNGVLGQQNGILARGGGRKHLVDDAPQVPPRELGVDAAAERLQRQHSVGPDDRGGVGDGDDAV